MLIHDGTGGGYAAKVDSDNELFTFSVTQTEDQKAVRAGRSYNINTGLIAYTSNGESSMLYVKNNETKDLIVDAIAVGVGTLGGTVTDSTYVTVVRNPTGGDIISDATAVAMNQNRNFGSSSTLTVDAYKGKEAGTMTGGNDIVLFQMDGNERLFAGINLVLTPGDSIGLKIDLNASTGGNAYGAVVLHKSD